MIELLKDKKFLIDSSLVEKGEFGITRDRLKDQLETCLAANKEAINRGELSDEATCYMAYWFNNLNAIVSRALVTHGKIMTHRGSRDVSDVYTKEYVSPETLYMIAKIMSVIRPYMNKSINDIKWVGDQADIERQNFYFNLDQLEGLASYIVKEGDKAIEIVKDC